MKRPTNIRTELVILTDQILSMRATCADAAVTARLVDLSPEYSALFNAVAVAAEAFHSALTERLESERLQSNVKAA